MILFQELVNSAPLRRLTFGYNYNIICEKIDFDIRKKNGLKQDKHNYITLSTVDDKRKATARSECDFFNLDYTSEYVYSNFIDEFTTLAALVEALGGDAEEFDNDIMTSFEEFDGDLEDIVKTKAGAEAAQTALKDSLKKHTEGKLGDNSPLLACKMISNKGGFLEFAKELNWIVPNENKELLPEITAFEHKRYKDATTKPKAAKPDNVGAAPEKSKPNLLSSI